MQNDGDKSATPINPMAEGGCLERLVRPFFVQTVSSWARTCRGALPKMQEYLATGSAGYSHRHHSHNREMRVLARKVKPIPPKPRRQSSSGLENPTPYLPSAGHTGDKEPPADLARSAEQAAKTPPCALSRATA